MSYILDREIQYLPGIGEKRAALLEKELGIRTFGDMLYTFPYRYIDRSKVYSISEIDSASAYIQLRGKIIRTSTSGSGKTARLVATLRDESGAIDLVFFKGLKWIQEKISPSREYIVFGKPSLFNGVWNMVHPELEPVGESGTSSWPSTLIGIYSSSDKLRNSGISVKVFARMQQTLQQKTSGLIRETLPQEVIAANRQGHEKPGSCPVQTQIRGTVLPPAFPAAAEKCQDERLVRHSIPQGRAGIQLLLRETAIRVDGSPEAGNQGDTP